MANNDAVTCSLNGCLSFATKTASGVLFFALTGMTNDLEEDQELVDLDQMLSRSNPEESWNITCLVPSEVVAAANAVLLSMPCGRNWFDPAAFGSLGGGL